MTASQRYKQALATCQAAGMTPDAARRMALRITRNKQTPGYTHSPDTTKERPDEDNHCSR